MSNANYTPFSGAPFAQPPLGAISGIREARADEMLRRAQELGLEGMLTGNKQAQFNLGRDEQMLPHDLAVRAQAGAVANATNNPTYINSQVQSQMAGHDTAIMNRDFQKATQPDKISATNAEAGINALTNQLMRIRAIGAAQGPMMAQAEYQKVLGQMGEAGKFMPSMYTPEGLEQTMKVLADTPAHRRTMEVEREQTNRAVTVGKGNNQATVDAAALRSQAARKSLILQFQSAKTPEMVLSYGQMLLADPDLEPAIRRQVEAGTEAATRIIAEKNARGSFDMSKPREGTAGAAAGIADRLRNPGQRLPHIHSMDELRRLYPGKSDEVIRNAYQKKFGTAPR